MVRKFRTSRARSLARRTALLLSSVAVGAAATAGAADAAGSYVPPPFEISGFAAPMLDASDNEVTLAGSHPFKLRNRIEVATDVDGNPVGSLKEAVVEMPVGFVGDPSDFPTCTTTELARLACPPAAQIGTFSLEAAGGLFPVGPNGLYNMEVPDGQPARFGTTVLYGSALVFFDASVRPEDDGITVTASDVSHLLPITSTTLEMWGVPADPVHDPQRVADPLMGGSGGPAGISRRPFLTLGTDCSKPPVTRLRAASWQHPDQYVEASYTAPPLTDCEDLSFEPGVKVQPDHTVAGQPAGYTVELTQKLNDNPDSKATAHLKDAVVALPKGVTVNPGVAEGLSACSEEQFGRGKDGAPACPASSRLGEVTVETPVLDEPLVGEVYQAAQNANPFGSTLAIYMAPKSDRYGVTMKLAGEVTTDPVTGRVTTTFVNNPEQPFSKLTLKLKGGDRAVLRNPDTCGFKRTEWAISSWADPGTKVTGDDTFGITTPPVGGSCVGGLFAPALAAGVRDAVAGKSSPFSMTFARGDGQQNLWSISAELPEGLLAHVGTVPLCPAAQANVGRCDAATRVGDVVAHVGAGTNPLVMPQLGKAPTHVYLSGPYGGAPYSLSMVVPAQAGPLNLGTVVARVGLFVDPSDAHVTARLLESRVLGLNGQVAQTVPGGMPQIIEGIPLPYRSITVNMNRPGFMLNPTSCEPKRISAGIWSANGAARTVANRFQVGGCGDLDLSPKLEMEFTGKDEVAKGKHPGLAVTLTQPKGQAGMKRVEVRLPLSVALDPDNAKALCSEAQANARACPAESVVGAAEVKAAILGETLKGNVHFVEGWRTTASGRRVKTLPKLLITLRGVVALDLMADSDVKNDQLVSTFPEIPDAPVEWFKLQINGGENGILAATGVGGDSLCAANHTAKAITRGQNGKRHTKEYRITAPCSFAVRSSSASGTHATLRVGGLGAGELSVRGRGINAASRTLRGSQSATIKPRLTSAGRATLRRGGSLRLTVSFREKGADKSTRRTVTVRGASR